MKGRQLILVLPLGLCLGLVLAMGNLVLRVRAEPEMAALTTPVPTPGEELQRTVTGIDHTPPVEITETEQFTPTSLADAGGAATATIGMSTTVLPPVGAVLTPPGPGAVITPVDVVTAVLEPGALLTGTAATGVLTADATGSPAERSALASAQVLAVDPPPHDHTTRVDTSLVATASAALSPTSVTSETFSVHGGFRGKLAGTLFVDGGTILFDPDADLLTGEPVEASATGGITAGGAALTPFVWRFRAAVGGGTGQLEDSGQSLGSADSYGVALGDVDGDGDLDAFVANNGANRVWRNEGNGGYSDSGQSLGSAASQGVALGDLDGDGDLDAFVANDGANQVWLNGGSGGYGAGGPGLGSANSRAVALGDVDGDGDLDAFVVNSGANRVWLNDSSGSFSDSGQVLGASNSYDVALGDVDADGDLDAFVANSSTQPNKVWLNAGGLQSGNLGTYQDSGQTLGSSWSQGVALGDLDGDGHLDALVANSGSQSNKAWRNDGAGGFSSGGDLVDSADSTDLALGDLDGDGDLDAVVANTSGFGGAANEVWRNNGQATFADTGQRLGESRSRSVALGDLDGDGDLDALAANLGANKVWLNGNRSDLTVVKSTDAGEVLPGDDIRYTLAYSNNGPQIATDVVITDIVPAQVTQLNYTSSGASITPTGSVPYRWRVEDLEPGDSGVITLTGVISPGLAASIAFTNSAEITATAEDPNPSDNRDRASLTAVIPDLSVAKSVVPEFGVEFHDLATYLIVLSNGGNGPAQGVMLTDTLPLQVDFARWVPGGQPPGASVSPGSDQITWTGTVAAGEAVTFTFEVTHVGGYGDVVTNRATFSHRFGSGSDDATFAVIAPPALSIAKEVTPAVDIPYHSEVTYTLVLSNRGVADAFGTVLTDRLPLGVDFARWAPAGRPAGAAEELGVIRWVGTVEAGEPLTFTFVVTHDGDYADLVTNVVSYGHVSGSGADSATFSVIAPPELALGKEVMPDTDIPYHSEVTYTLVLSNEGVADAYGTVLTDELPAGVEFGRWVVGGRPVGAVADTGGVIHWTGTVTSGQGLTFAFVVTHTGGYGDVVLNVAEYDQASGSGSAGAVFSVVGPPDLRLRKTAVPGTDVAFHGEVTYTIVVSNAGELDAADVGLTDTLPAEVAFGRWLPGGQPLGAVESGGTITWTGPLQVGEALTFTFAVTHTGAYGDLVVNEAELGHWSGGTAGEATFSVIGPPDLVIEKRSSAGQVLPGDAVTFTLAYANQGPMVAGGVLISDRIPASLTNVRYDHSGPAITPTGQVSYTWQVEDLPPGSGGLITVAAVASPGLPAGVFTNAATITHALPEGDAGDNRSEVAVRVVVPDLAIDKRVEPDVDVVHHSQVTYTIVLSNSGDGDARDVVLTDDLPVEVEFARWAPRGQPPGATQSDGEIRWTGTGTAGQAVTLTFLVRHVGQYGDVVTNVAAYDYSFGSGSDGTAFAVLPPPDLYLTKTSWLDVAVLPGDPVTFTLAYGNSGPSVAYGVVISDPLPSSIAQASYVSTGTRVVPVGGVSYTWSVEDLYPGAGGAITISALLKQPLLAGTFTNTAEITSSTPDAGGADNRARVGVRVVVPDLSIEKTVVPEVDVAHHGEVTYTIVISNDGEGDAEGVVISDSLPSLVEFRRWAAGGQPPGANQSGGAVGWSGTLAPGEAVNLAFVAGHVGTYGDVVTNTSEYGHWSGNGSDQAIFTVIAPPELGIHKWVSPETSVAYHADVTYTVVLSNGGVADAYGSVLTDRLPAEVEFERWVSGGKPARAIQAGRQITWTGTVTASQAVTLAFVVRHDGDYADLVTNSVTYAHVSGSGADSVTFSVIAPPELALGKEVMPDTEIPYHSEVTYTLVLSNDGVADAYGTVLTDGLPAGVEFGRWVAGGRPVGAVEEAGGVIHWTGTVTSGKALTFAFVATHTGNYGDLVLNTAEYDQASGSGSAGATFSVVGPPDLRLRKTAVPDTDVAFHGEVTYTIVLSNGGVPDAEELVLADPLPELVAFDRWVRQPANADLAEREVTWAGTLTAGEAISLSFVVSHTGTYGDLVTNTAAYTHVSGAGNDSATFTVIGPPDLTVHKTVSPPYLLPGAALTYTIAYSNRGATTASAVTLVDEVPLSLTQVISASSGARITATAGLTYSWQVEDLSPGAGGLIIIGGVVSEGLPYGTVLTNSVFITNSLPDGDAGDNQSRVRLKVRERLTGVQPPATVHTASLTTSFTATTDGLVQAGSVTSETFRAFGQFQGLLGGSYAVNMLGCGGCAIFDPVDTLYPGEVVQTSVTEGVVVGGAPLVAHVWQFRGAVVHGTGRFTDNGQEFWDRDSQDVALGDLDGDGDIDTVVANNGGQGNRVWLSDGRGMLVDSGQSLGSGSSWGAALADVDGDGDLDLFVANTLSNTVWLNGGTGRFGAGGQSLGTADSRDVALGDLDGDGDLDAFVANLDGANEIWVNDGAGNFHAGDVDLGSGLSWGVALGDLDTDGDLDAFVANTGANRVWLNDGQAGFTSIGPGLGAAGSRSVALGDLDGDGDLDAFVGNQGVLGAPNAVWLNDGLAGFRDSGQGLGISSTLGVALGDLDGDGDLDAFAANAGPAGDALNVVWENGGHGDFGASAQDLGVSDTSRAVALGDVDRDGDLDAFVANDGSNRLWLNGSRADLALTKTVAPNPASPGQTIAYRLVYTNYGPQVAREVVITDLVPISVTVLSYASSGAALTPTGAASYTWEVADLWPGTGGIITVTGVTSPDLSAGEFFTNTAVITAAVEDGHLTDNESQVTVTIGMPVLSIAKAVTPEDLLYHREVTYTVVLSNSEDGDGVGVVLTDRLPARVEFVRWVQRPVGASEAGGKIIWTGAVKAGDALRFIFVAVHTGDYSDIVTNRAGFSHWSGSGSDTAIFTVIEPPQLVVVKSIVPELDVAYHGEVTYSLVLANSGAADALGVALSDTVPAEVAFDRWLAGGRPVGAIASGDLITWTGLVQAGGSVTFTFVVSHVGDYRDVVTNSAVYSHFTSQGHDDAVFVVVGPPDLTLDKSAVPNGLLPGEEVRFILDFANEGPSTAHGVMITDVVPVAVTALTYEGGPGLVITPTGDLSYTWAMEDLEPGRGGTISITGILDPELAPGAAINNTAQITATTPEEDPTDNKAGAVVMVLGRVLQVTPPRNVHTATLDTDLSAALSGMPSAGSVTADTFTAHGGLHGKLTGTFTLDGGANRIVFDPAADLFPGEQLEATASDGILIGDAPLVPYVWQFRAGVAAGTGEFGTSAYSLFGGGTSNAVALGDLDGDGDLDAVVANLNSEPQEVWLNDGDGRFGASAHDLFGAGESTSVALGDLDGDGDLDAVIANLNSQSQVVWLNDGSGSFGSLAHDAFGGGETSSVALGDMDGDGDLDAVLANLNSEPQKVWLNDGTGRFGASAHDAFGGGQSTYVALGDLDADGDLDAVVANYWLEAQEVWLNDGRGDMGAGDTFGAGMSWSLALGDVDGDADLDVVVVGDDGQPQEVWHNDGKGVFEAGDTFGGSRGRSLALGDLDGDGDLDAVVANEFSQAQEVWLGDGAGSFGAATHQTFGGGWSRTVALGDVDGDGDLDAVVANAFGEAEEVWLNQDWVVSVQPAPNIHTVPLATDLVVTTSSAVRSGSITTRTISVHGGFQGDVSGASAIGAGGRTVGHQLAKDFLPGERVQATVPTAVVDRPYVWEFRAAALGGSGTFGAAAHDTFGSGYSTAVAWGDVDTDGDLDVVVANNYSRTQKVWLNDGAGGFGATAHDSFGGGWSTSLALGDVDGDGDLDAVLANDIDQAQEVWLNDGTGNFGVAAHHAFGAGDSTSVALGDLDGDGDLDAVVANRNGQPQEVWLNDGTGQYGAGAYDSFGGGYSRSVALGDVDADGDLDAIVANDNGEPQEVWLNDGAGDFGAAPNDTFGAGYTRSLALGDVDGDGDLDAVISNDYLLPQQVWSNDGNGNYGLAAHQSFGGPGLFIVLADLDADGDLDAVLVNEGRTQEVWRNDGRGSFGLAAHDTFGGGYSTNVAPGDADGDGDLDILVANFDRPQEVWLNQDGADLRLHKAVTPSGYLAPGDPMTYILVYSNAGPQTALGVVITDRVPVSVTGVHYESSGADLVSVGSTPYTWQVADLEPGDGGVITITGLLSLPLIAGTFSNTALIATTLVDNAPEDSSSAARVTVANIAPVAVDDDYAISAAISLTVPAPGVLGNDSDLNGDSLASHLLQAPVAGTLDLKADGSFKYTPTLGLDGVVTFTYLASDGTLTSSATVTLDARADNQLPTISSIPDHRTKVGVPVGPIAFTVDDEETDPGDLTVSAGSSDPLLVDVAHIVLGGSGANRLVTVAPQAGITGTAVITLTVSDGADDASTAFRLTVENYRSYLPVILRD